MRNSNLKPAAFYVPRDLDLAIFAEEHRWYVAYFLNLLHWKWLCWKADEHGYVKLKHQYITRVIPRDTWLELRDRLSGKAVIQHSAFWTPGARSMGYRLAPEFRHTKRIVCTDTKLNRKIQRVYRKENHLLPVHRWLSEKLESVDFDLETARTIIRTLEPDLKSQRTLEEYRAILDAQCLRITNTDVPLTVDRFGRVHTPITCLEKHLRCCLGVKGERLVNIDLANSQPLIAGIVAAGFHRDRSVAQRFRHRVFDQGKNPYRRRMPKPAETDRHDLKRYLTVCQEGHIYESLGENRETVKAHFLTAMYDKNRANPSALLCRLSEEYPSVTTMLTSLKKKNYKHASHIMQNAESTIFIHGVCEKIMSESPELPIFTIHDSIMTTPNHAEHVESVILDQFATLGITPTLKIEYL